MIEMSGMDSAETHDKEYRAGTDPTQDINILYKRSGEVISEEHSAYAGILADKKFFEKKDVLPAVRNMASIITSHGRHASIELVRAQAHNGLGRSAIILRTAPEAVILPSNQASQEEDGNAIVEWSQPAIWKSKGVKVEKVGSHMIISYMIDSDHRTREPGWVSLASNPTYLEYEDRMNESGLGVSNLEKLRFALSLSSPYTDNRIGDSPDSLIGCSEPDGVALRIR